MEGLATIPHNRWDGENDYFWGKAASASRVGFAGFIADLEVWDHSFFGISLGEGSIIDPHQSTLLTATIEAMYMAGETVSRIRSTDRAVAVGYSCTEHTEMMRKFGIPLQTYTPLMGALSVACGRISYLYGLSGPSFVIDTACSASLVSTHLASDLMQKEECETAFACGVNCTLIQQTYALLAHSNMLAPDGRCKTLDSSADGYVRGEACGILQLGFAGW